MIIKHPAEMPLAHQRHMTGMKSFWNNELGLLKVTLIT
jgi:hypothetical protein